MGKSIHLLLAAVLFALCAVSASAQAPTPDVTKVEASTRRDFAGKKVHVTGGATLEFKRDMTGIKYGGALGKFTVPFTWKVEGEFAVTNGSATPLAPPETLYWKFTNRTDIVAGRTKEKPTFTATAGR
jgi:hypothetical protein